MPRQPYLIKEGGSWMFYQPEITVSYYQELLHAMDIMHTQLLKAERIFRKIILACGNCNIDAMLSLAVVLNRTGRQIEGNALVHKAHLVCMEALPPYFNPDQDDIYWCILENRPLLRSFHAVITEYIKEKQYERALDKINYLLKINKNDDTGVAALLPVCCMYLGRYAEYLEWYQQLSPLQRTLETTFFSFLALYKLDLPEQAKARFLEARKAYPNMAAELLKSNHQFPADEFKIHNTRIPAGSRQEAFVCWLASRELWQREKELKKFLQAIPKETVDLP
ncbi:hypothetical protein [Chitinophaga sp. HK235]|uniref:hypothetical protein n=1 Tax=Chitinophaga sp. HK235 TaxID=2952571 RepID=UPI001BAC908F|nr:hypothetical protein [Chitinophaga sp. HK235]